MRGPTRSAALRIAAALAASTAIGGCGGAVHTGGGQTSAEQGQPSPTTPAPGSAGQGPAVPSLIPPPDAASRSVQVPVLTYHRVAPVSAVGQLDLKVEPANFAAELSALHDAGYHTVRQAQLFAALYKGAPLPPRPIIISVDDGYVDDVRTILPDLERWHMVATFFVITGRMQEPGFLSAEEIRQLDRAGMDVGDHTAHHLDLPALSGSALATEIAGSRRLLQEVVGHPVYFFAYPFGAYDDKVLSEVRAAGFTMAYTTAGGVTESTQAPLTMPRVHVGRAQTPSGLISTLGGA